MLVLMPPGKLGHSLERSERCIERGISDVGCGAMISFNFIGQGFFAGIMVGKFSEGSLKQGLLHSLILMTTAALIITTAKGGI